MSNHIVLIIEGTFPWYRGGVSEWVDRYIKHCQDSTFGIIQIVLPPYFGRTPDSGIYPIRDQITDFKQVQPPDMQLSAMPGNAPYINEWLSDTYKEVNPLLREADIVHAANTGFAGLLGAFIKKREPVPFVVTEHAVYWKEVDQGAVALECGLPVVHEGDEQSGNVKDTFRKVARAVYGKADYTVSVAHYNIPSQQRLGADTVAYIPNGVDEESLCEDLTVEADRPTLTVGWAGRCAHIKQPHRFLDMAEYMARQRNASHPLEVNFPMYLSRAGEEELENEVSQRAAGMPGVALYWNQPAKQAMRDFDALCISSISEAQPLVALEAIAAKALPFGWECGDLDSELGYFFPQERPVAEVADKITELWRQPSMWRSKVDQLFEKVKGQHTWQQIFRQYRELFAALVEPSNPSEEPTT